MKKILIIVFILFSSLAGIAQNPIVDFAYYVVEDPGIGNATPVSVTPGKVTELAFDVDVSHMTAFNQDAVQGELRTIDPLSGNSTYLGTFRGGMEISGFAISHPAEPIQAGDYALRFDGQDDYLLAGNVPFIQGDYTVEAWINPYSITADHEIFDWYGANDGAQLFVQNNGALSYGEYGNGAWVSVESAPGLIPTHTWTHVAMVKQEGNCTLFINGQAVSSGLVNQCTSAINFGIGSRTPDFDTYFNGEIDEIRVWDLARSETEIAANMCGVFEGIEPGIYALWHFNDGPGFPFASDSGPNGFGAWMNNMQPNAGADCSWTAHECFLPVTNNNALHFDGVNDFVTVPDITCPQQFTIECWINFQGLLHASYITLVEFDNDNPWLGISRGKATLYQVVSSDQQIGEGWHHLAFVVGESTSTIFVDGQEAGFANQTPSISNTPGMGIGFHYGDTPFTGLIDELRIWNYPRSEAQINAVKNSELSGSEAGLLAYYNFNQGIAGGNNQGLSTLYNNTQSRAYNGTLNNFALSGNTSNFVDGTWPISDLQAEFMALPLAGIAPLEVEFSDFSTGEITDWLWEFGDGNTSNEQNPVHTYLNPGTYTVSLTVSNELTSDTETKAGYITVEAITIFDIQYTDIPGNDSTYPSPYVGQTVTVSGIVTAAGTAEAPNEFYISSPEGGPWNGIFVFNADGEPEAGDEVVVSGNVDEYNGFTEIHSPSISILSHNNALPAPAITSSGQLTIPWSAEAWEGGLVQVQNVAATQLVNQYGEWYVDDGSGQCQIEDEYVYFEPFVGQNFSSITGVVEYGFGQYAINPRFVEDIVAIELIAGFSSSTVTGTAPLIVAFTDQSQGNISTWWWDFGDGGTSEVQNPTHIYQNPGIYSVSLIVSDGIVSDEIIMKNLIQVNEPGQGNWLAEYFYDEDPGYGNATAIYGNGDAEVLISFNAPIGHLADGLHTFYSRSKNENGTWSQTMARTFLKQSLPGDTNPNITYLEYFFDSDPGFGEASPIAFGAGNPMEVAINLPLENLSFGLHTLYVRSQDENGKWSIVMQRSFIMGNYPADPLKQLVKAEYFIDEDPGQGMAEPVMFDPNNGIHEQQFDANLDGLEWGEHTLYVRTMDESGGWSITVAESFDVEEPPIIAEFSADITQGSVPLTVQFTDETYIGEPTEWLWDFGDGNSSNIQNPQHTYGNPGTYTVSLTATNMEGTNTEVKENYITVYPPLYSLEYFFDEDPGYGNASGVYAYSSNLGGFNFLIPMDELTDGYHLLFVRVKDTSSVWTQTMTRSFLKTRLVKDPDPNISKMEYFIDEDPGLGGAISLPLTQNPLPVVEALIPLDDYTDGLHNIFVRSQDENGRWSETFVRPFLKSYLPEDVAYVVGLEYFVDDDPGVGNGTAVSVPNPGAAIERSFVVNLGVQTPGEHRLFVRAIDSRGHWSLVYNQLIEVTATGAVHVVQLPEGWSGISSYIIPDDAAVANIFAPIQEELVIVQNFDGMYWPTAGVNTLGNWDDHAGYQIKMETAQQVTFTGEMQDNLKANLTAGWNYLPVLNACDNDVEDLFAPLIGHLQIVKDVAAWGVYWPQFGVNTLGALIPGKAYFVLVDDDVEVEFPVCETPANFRQLAERKEPASGKQTEGRKEPASEDQIDKNNQSDNSDVWSSAVALRGGSPVPSRGRAGDGVIKTPLTHTVAIPAQAISGIAEGSIITIYNQHGSCCGAAIFQNQNLALTAFGDDPTTSQIDGLTEGEPMNFRILNPETGKAFALEVVYDDQMPQGGYFVNHGLSSVKELKITGVEDAVESPMNISVYPNPSSGVFQVSTQSVRQLADQSGFGWEVSNAHGSIVATGDNHADAFTIDLSNHPKGIYYLKIKQRGWQTVKKLVLQ